MNSFNVPMIVVGGGGYTIDNVAKAWTNETGVLLNEKLDKKLPFNQYYDEYTGPKSLLVKVSIILWIDYHLHLHSHLELRLHLHPCLHRHFHIHLHFQIHLLFRLHR